MATIETNPQLGERVQADAKEYVLHSWSVQSAINPLPVAGAEGRYFWDFEGKRYKRIDHIRGLIAEGVLDDTLHVRSNFV